MNEELQDIPEEVREDIEKRANVVGTAVGPIREDDEPTDEVGVVVLVTEKLPEDALSRQDLVPETIDIDGKRYQTQVIEVGHLHAQGTGQQVARQGSGSARQRVVGRTEKRAELLQEATTPAAQHIPTVQNRRRKWRPAPAGISVAHGEVTAGTLGSPPLRTADDKIVFLTNAHVAAPIGAASAGDPILQPGPADGGTPQDVIGHLLEWTEIEREGANACDSALVEIDDDLVDDDILALGDIEGWAEPEIGVEYVKSGRTTGVTSSELLGRNARVQVGGYYPGEATTFEGVDVFGAMSAGGDSGSLIGNQREDGFYATDLLFAGSDRSTIGAPMNVVQDLHGSLTPDGGSRGEQDRGAAGSSDTFDRRVRRQLINRFGAESVDSIGDGEGPSGYRVETWPVSLLVAVAEDREEALDSVGHVFADIDGESLPVVVFPAEAGDRPLLGRSGVPVIPIAM